MSLLQRGKQLHAARERGATPVVAEIIASAGRGGGMYTTACGHSIKIAPVTKQGGAKEGM